MNRTPKTYQQGMIGLAVLALCACKISVKTAEPPPTPPEVAEEAPAQGPLWPDEPFRAQMPAPGPIAGLQLPAIKTFKLSNGLEVFLVRQERLPTVYMTMEFDLGAVNDAPNRAGMHSLCFDLIDESTKRRDKIAWEEALADHALQMWSGSGRETSNLSLRTLKAQLDPALDLFVEMLREPGLRSSDFARLRDRRKASMVQARATPASIARRVYPALAWGTTHPYGHITTEETLDSVRVADCKRVVARLRPSGARLFVVGMISEEELRSSFGERLAKWRGRAPVAAKIPEATQQAGAIYLVDAPGAAQSVISIGHPGPGRAAPDYEATYLMAQILGGSFSSRINMNLREDKGFAYGGRGGFRYARNGSSFSAGASVRTDSTGASLREVAKEIQGMRAAPPTDAELRREKAGAIAALPARFATATRTLRAFKALSFYGLDLGWYDGYTARIGGVLPAGVHRAAQDHLQERDFVVFVVGDASIIKDDLQVIADEKLFGDGGLIMLDADGQRVGGTQQKKQKKQKIDKLSSKPAPKGVPRPAGPAKP